MTSAEPNRGEHYSGDPALNPAYLAYLKAFEEQESYQQPVVNGELMPYAPQQGELTISITARDDGLGVFQDLANKALGGVQRSRVAPQETLYYDEPDDRAALEALEASPHMSPELAQALVSMAKKLTSGHDAETEGGDDDTDDALQDAELAVRVADADRQTVEQRARKIRRNRALYLAALVLAGSFTYHTFGSAAADAREACSPSGTGGVLDVAFNQSCYTIDQFLGSYVADITNYLPWGKP